MSERIGILDSTSGKPLVLSRIRPTNKEFWPGFRTNAFGGHVLEAQSPHDVGQAGLKTTWGIEALDESRFIDLGTIKVVGPKTSAGTEREFASIFWYQLTPEEAQRLTLDPKQGSDWGFNSIQDIREQAASGQATTPHLLEAMVRLEEYK